jgi:hypothetical protein
MASGRAGQPLTEPYAVVYTQADHLQHETEEADKCCRCAAAVCLGGHISHLGIMSWMAQTSRRSQYLYPRASTQLANPGEGCRRLQPQRFIANT